MSMIKYFFDINMKEESRKLFKGLNIEKDKQILKFQGEYPVIFITLKELKSDSFEGFLNKLRLIVSKEFSRHQNIINNEKLNESDLSYIKRIITGIASKEDLEFSIISLTELFFKYYNKKVILLIDEYDVPIQEGYMNGYYNKVISFMRNLLGAGLKGNLYVEKAMLTGILRVAKESIFSGLNNLEVDTIIKNKFSDKFGFLENDIDQILSYYKKDETNKEKDMLKEWYNGYVFGNNVIYNPWSVLNYIDNYEEGFKPYWINSSENILVKKILSNGDEEIKKEFQDLIENKSIEKVIDDNIVMGEIEGSSESVWSFLLMTGYLKVTKKENIEGILQCTLEIPNKEVYIYFKNMILKWFDDSLSMLKYKNMLDALINGDIENFGYIFKEFVINNLSYFDISGKEPEKIYHAFVLGMLISLSDNYEVKSNKESGYGRYDVMIIPKNNLKNGIIIEFKKINEFSKETIEEGISKALKQIEDKKYETELLNKGIKNIIKLAIVFKGKNVEVTQKSKSY
ncbi:PD-(D/E)XK nuclease superfamily protein [Clostridium uliginosum]|uniref:PD-(D/E)XK nuclease superfamily protein n=2 Tax=Clostridium uliginosum TaxID=119641 RepID=A0A1I1QXP7_9CLOT|nr:PD-(D/E)XK nuclease superfamily protein [Clostridium uliginosum]